MPYGFVAQFRSAEPPTIIGKHVISDFKRLMLKESNL